MRLPPAVLAPLALVLLLAGCRGGAADGLVAEVGRVAGGAREPGPRLSISASARCSDLPGAERPCPDRRRRRREAAARELAVRAAAAVRERVDADALHAAGLVDLLWADSAGRSLDRSIQSLRSAARIAEHPAPVLADLSAALLVRAARADQPRDLFEAAEAAAEAVEADSGSVAGRFNLALALEEIGLVDASTQAWEGYLARDGRSRWAVRARGRLAALRRPPPALPPLERPEHAAAFVSASPQEALYGGFDRLLPEWGAAVLAGDSARAAERLSLAEAVGAALVGRGGDASLADAVAAVRAAGDVARLAAAHVRYGEARRMYVEARYGDAAEAFGQTFATAELPAALRAWATLFHGAALVLGGRVAEGGPLIERVAAEADSLRNPSLSGRAYWSVGTLTLRAGDFEQSARAYRTAERRFTGAVEEEHLGAVQCGAAGMEFELGSGAPAFASLQRALMTLRPFRSSRWLHSCLVSTAHIALGESFLAIASAAQDEDVAVARSTGNPAYAAESYNFRARQRARAGDLAGARADVDSARVLVGRVGDGVARRWFAADYEFARLSVDAAHRTASATSLDTAVAFFSEPALPLRLVPILSLRARSRAAAGDVAGAAEDLTTATDLLHQVRSRVQRASLRAAMADAASATVDELVRLEAARDRPTAALVTLERGRAMLRGKDSLPEMGRIEGPRGAVAAGYALIGDTLYIWAIRDRSVRLTRLDVGREAFLRTVARAAAALEEGQDAALLNRELELLYRWLIDPIGDFGSEGVPLVVIADGDISSVPFAALRNPTQRRFLVEERPLRFATSLADARRPHRTSRLDAALLIADPAFDPMDDPGADRLSNARAEVQAIQALYPFARTIAGSIATVSVVRSAMQESSLIHYAGHAVFDDGRPDGSYLLLAGGRLTAGEFVGRDLSGVRLVVLSACRTLPGRAGRSGGFAGMAGALISAGVEGVVGATREVRDAPTRQLMEHFHADYRQTLDAAGALQRAQIAMLHSPDPAHRPPAAWAAFRYIGR